MGQFDRYITFSYTCIFIRYVGCVFNSFVFCTNYVSHRPQISECIKTIEKIGDKEIYKTSLELIGVGTSAPIIDLVPLINTEQPANPKKRGGLTRVPQPRTETGSSSILPRCWENASNLPYY